LKILVPIIFFGKRRMINLVDGGQKDNRLDIYSIFERMEVRKDSVGNLKS
jgi:hypothetical protein